METLLKLPQCLKLCSDLPRQNPANKSQQSQYKIQHFLLNSRKTELRTFRETGKVDSQLNAFLRSKKRATSDT